MKKIINGKVYDTDTARELGSWANTWDLRSCDYEHESLYQKRTGEYFLFGEGGPTTKYAVSTSDNNWASSAKIIPLSVEAAKQWAEDHLDATNYEQIFGLPGEDADDAVLYVKVPAQIMAKLKAQAAEAKTSLSEIVNKMLNDAL